MGDEPKLVTLDAVMASLVKAQALARELRAKQEELWAEIGTASYLLEHVGEEYPFDPDADKYDVDKEEG